MPKFDRAGLGEINAVAHPEAPGLALEIQRRLQPPGHRGRPCASERCHVDVLEAFRRKCDGEDDDDLDVVDVSGRA
jgi:hypothetical protein